VTAPLVQERAIVVASYNVHRCVGTDGREDPSRIAAVVREIGADVVGLQEIESRDERTAPTQLDALSRETGFCAVAGAARHHAAGGFGNALLTRLPIAAVRRVDLSVPKREPRGLLDVELDWEGERVRVLTTHLGLSGAERRVQILSVLGELHLERERLTVLCGDFNEWLPGGRPLRALERRFARRRSPRTFPSWRPLFALDRIWVEPLDALATLRRHATRLARTASDHLPIVATIRRGPSAS
jgi:endonuclease/exonuclease/phosphatase family metal-dependent hydrolase